ncbi:MAG: copper chaperone PCu(A)C [Brevundimonas sp.]|uniref:copper chaperone PCu(A)C n=1 Tax=Brevundimonas sp. TaxID=1871086 RepID=UPI00391C7752
MSLSRILPVALAGLALSACGRDAATPTTEQDVEKTGAAVAVTEAWCRPTPNGVAVGACYVSLTAQRKDRLVDVRSPVSDDIQIHEMRTEGDMMRMGVLPDGLELPAGRTVTLRPGAEHLMLMDLSQPLAAGETAELTLVFQNAPDVTVQAQVREPVAPAPAAVPAPAA